MNDADRRRFLSHVDSSAGPDACHLWKPGPGHPFGYGTFWCDRRNHSAHRIAWAVAHGMDVPRGRQVRHTCDNPICVNPEHLRLGTQRDNMHDRQRHGAGYARGTAHHNAKLTPEAVAEGQRLRLEGWSYARIAAHLGVTKPTAMKAVQGKSWAHLAAPPANLPRTVHVSRAICDWARELRAAGVKWSEVERLTGYTRKGITKYW